MSEQERRFTFPTDRSQFTRLYHAIAEVAIELGMSVEEQFRFGLCISEAYTNAFVHGNEQDANKSIHVRFSWERRSVRVDIEDEGETAAAKIDLLNATATVSADRRGGRGIGIIKNYADRIEVEPRKEGGLRMTIFWDLTARSTNSVAN